MAVDASTVLTPGQLIYFLQRLAQLKDDARTPDYLVSEILESILFNGPIVADIPETLLDESIYRQLVSEELLTIRPFGYSDKVLYHAKRVYEAAFNGYRTLETHPAQAPIISYQQYIAGVTIDNVELAATYSDIEFGTKQLQKLLDPLVTSMQNMFGYYFDLSMGLFSTVALDVLSAEELSKTEMAEETETETTEDNIKTAAKAEYWSTVLQTLNQAMGLYIRSAPELDQTLNSVAFTPEDLGNINESFLGLFATDFEAQAMRRMRAEIGVDLEKNLVASVFWKTVLDLYNAARHCEHANGILMLPKETGLSQSQVSPSPVDRDLVRVYKLYLSERRALPRLDNVDDLLRLRDDEGLRPLKDNLKAWRGVGTASDEQVIREIRKEIALATQKMKWAQSDSRIGQVIGYIGLPIAVADALFPSGLANAFSLVAGAMGLAIDKEAASRIGKLSWINFGLGESTRRRKKSSG